MNLATGDREVTLIHCIEDRLCVWRPYSLLFLDIASGVHDMRMLQIAHPEVIPHGIRCEGLLRVLSWVSFDLPTHLKGMVTALCKQLAGVTQNCTPNHSRTRHTRRATQQWSGAADGNYRHDTSSRRFPRCWRATCLRSSSWILQGFSLRTLLFLLDMVLPQLDAYHAGRNLQHLQPWASVELMQQQLRRQSGTSMHLTYQYEGYAGFHVLQLHTEGAPVLLFVLQMTYLKWLPELCVMLVA